MSERTRRAREIFGRAVDLGPPERERFARSACGDDTELLSEVLSLLTGHDASQSPLDRPAAEALGVEDAVGLVDASVEVTGNAAERSAWAAFLGQLRSRGPAHERYVFEGEIAHGGMGAVHRVYDRDAKRRLALKVMLGKGPVAVTGDTPTVDDASLGRFLDEAQVTSQLDHPGIVPVHEIGVDGAGRVYFTMKLVKGEDLRSIFDRVHDPNDEDWTITRALNVMLRVCEAMAYAHDKGVVHRDLKPGNVMVGRFGEVYVMDWGLAHVLRTEDRKDIRLREPPVSSESLLRTERQSGGSNTPGDALLTMDGDVLGTPAYMPPEQAAGRLEEIGPRSDVYSVGALLYHLLAGHMPYVRPGELVSNRRILGMVLRDAPPPIASEAPETPAELAAICEKAMSRPIDARYPTMEALSDDLRAFLENRVVKAHATGRLAELRKWVARNRGLAAALVLAFVLCGVALLAGAAFLVERARSIDRVRTERMWSTLYDAYRWFVIDTNAAVTGLTNALEMAPNQSEARVGRALAWLEVRRYEEALAVLNPLGGRPTDERAEERVRAFALQGLDRAYESTAILDALGPPVTALEHYVTALEHGMQTVRNPSREATSIRLHLQRALVSAGPRRELYAPAFAMATSASGTAADAEAAAKIFESLSDGVESRFCIGIALHRHDPPRALSILGKLVESFPDGYDGYYRWGPQYLIGQVLGNTGDRLGAIEAYRSVIKANPKHYEAMTNLALVLKEVGDAAVALPIIERAAEIAPRNPLVLTTRALVLETLGRTDAALKGYLDAAEIGGHGNFHALANLTYLAERTGRLQDALTIGRRLVEAHPNEVSAHLNLGSVLSNLGHTEQAEVAFHEALRLDPTKAMAVFNLGVIAFKRDRFDAAFELASRALALGGLSPQADEVAHEVLGVSFGSLMMDLESRRDAAIDDVDFWRRLAALLSEPFLPDALRDESCRLVAAERAAELAGADVLASDLVVLARAQRAAGDLAAASRTLADAVARAHGDEALFDLLLALANGTGS